VNSQIIITIECDPPLPDGTTLAVKHDFQEADHPTTAACPTMMTLIETAAYIRVHSDTLWKWVRLGKFPRIPLPCKGKDFRFRRAAIDAWIERRELGGEM
jgi:excisionase family DNA binding protein